MLYYDILISEDLGTFIFLSVIAISLYKDKELAWLKIGLTLSVCILLIGFISGGHMNPAVSLLLYFTKDIGFEKLLTYGSGQIIGTILAYFYYSFKISSTPIKFLN